MRIDILTLFPQMFSSLKESILGRAVKENKLEINIYDIRDYTLDKHNKCDDYTFGGGAGMILTPQPVFDCINAIDPEHNARRIYLSPKGRRFVQAFVGEYLLYERIILLCGHYEGIDQRIIDLCIDEELSIGDFVLTGGEIPAMAFTDCVSRYVEGVISGESLKDETFTGDLLEYPQYTRPQEFRGLCVPEVLIGGDHGKVDKWRLEQSLELTKKLRPEMYEKYMAEHPPVEKKKRRHKNNSDNCEGE